MKPVVEMSCSDKTLDGTTHHPLAKWGRIHRDYLKSIHPDLYRQLLLNRTLNKENGKCE